MEILLGSPFWQWTVASCFQCVRRPWVSLLSDRSFLHRHVTLFKLRLRHNFHLGPYNNLLNAHKSSRHRRPIPLSSFLPPYLQPIIIFIRCRASKPPLINTSSPSTPLRSRLCRASPNARRRRTSSPPPPPPRGTGATVAPP